MLHEDGLLRKYIWEAHACQFGVDLDLILSDIVLPSVLGCGTVLMSHRANVTQNTGLDTRGRENLSSSSSSIHWKTLGPTLVRSNDGCLGPNEKKLGPVSRVQVSRVTLWLATDIVIGAKEAPPQRQSSE